MKTRDYLVVAREWLPEMPEPAKIAVGMASFSGTLVEGLRKLLLMGCVAGNVSIVESLKKA